jgi:hypothetical protein
MPLDGGMDKMTDPIGTEICLIRSSFLCLKQFGEGAPAASSLPRRTVSQTSRGFERNDHGY